MALPNMLPDAAMLGDLARAQAPQIKDFAETIIDGLGEIEVLQSQTGLVMLPMKDTAGGTTFHLGEVLVSQAHIRSPKAEGYGMRQGRDLEAAMAMALIDLAMASGVATAECTAFCAKLAADHAAKDDATLRDINATRVEMETF